jgi:hypothetical protein
MAGFRFRARGQRVTHWLIDLRQLLSKAPTPDAKCVANISATTQVHAGEYRASRDQHLARRPQQDHRVIARVGRQDACE